MSDAGNPKTPETFRKGEEFEKYVRNNIFTKEHYIIVEKTHQYLQNFEDFIESTRNPDFKLRDKLNNREFYLEAKFRSATYKDKLDWCRSDQLKRYQEFNKVFPVFIIIGLGGSPANPRFLYLIPLVESKYTELYKSALKKFEIPANLPVPTHSLWDCLK